MFDPRALSMLLAYGQEMDAADKAGGELSRALLGLSTRALGIEDFLTGPARDIRAQLADADAYLADALGKVREARLALASLLNAQNLPQAVSGLGWTFDGWVDGAGWTAWRTWEAGGARETLGDHHAAELLHKLRLRNAQEARRA